MTLEKKFLAAWKEIENPELDSVNPHFKNKYASLKATLSVIRKACEPHGIGYYQRQKRTEAGMVYLSMVTDGEETMVITEFPFEYSPNSQAFGSNITYARRQQAQSDWSIVGEEDDDGAKGAQEQRNKQQANEQRLNKKIEENFKKLEEQQAKKERLQDIKSSMVIAEGMGFDKKDLSEWVKENIGKSQSAMNEEELDRVLGYLEDVRLQLSAKVTKDAELMPEDIKF